jgi:hypothetical protein
MPKPNPKDKLKIEKPEETETKSIPEITPEKESDRFSDDERKDLLTIIEADIIDGEKTQEDYTKQKKLDLMHYHSAKPSEIEGLTKKSWMSDRNLGLGRAIAESFDSILFATCWNPDTINFTATQTFEIDNRTNQEKFTKWGMGKQEANAAPQVRAFTHNRTVVGSAFYKIYRKEVSQWVDKRTPVKNKKGDTYKWDIKTEKVKIIKGMIENIEDVDDILMPAYIKNIQESPYFIHILHLDGETVLDYLDRKIYIPADKEAYKTKLHNHAFKEKERVLGEEKLKQEGINSTSMTDTDVRRLPIDLYEWYGYYTKNNRTEKWRVTIDLVNKEVLGGKPIRKINRSGKIPFVGRRDISMMQIIATVLNAFNNIFNQKADFQFVTNCPFGFYKPDEGYTQQKYELEPMVCYPSDDPTKINFPNLSRSMAWAESDMRILFEILERLTGAATYFAIGQQRNKTLGQDLLVDKQSETRFGDKAKGIIEDTCEAISMWFELYQDYPPKGLAERVVGVDGKKLFPNLSVNNFTGDTAVQMTPDTVAGSKAYRKQLQLWAFQAGQQSIWLNPQINPEGNYNLTADTFKEILSLSDNDIIRYLGEKPKAKFDVAELDNEWYRFMNGEDFDPPEGETMLAQQHLEGHMKQKQEKYNLLSEEYRPNFDAHIFKTTINYMKFLKNMQQESMANMIASSAIMAQGGQPPQQVQGQPPAQPANASVMPAGQPGQGGIIPGA